MRHDGFPTHGVEAVHLNDIPALRVRIGAGAAFVVLRAFAAHLVFS